MQASLHIGYDPQHPEAFAVARHSVRRLMSRALPIGGVHIAALRREGLYRRADDDMSVARFFTPAIAGWKGWAIYLTGNALALTDPARIMETLDPRFAVMWGGEGVMAFNCGHFANAALTLDLLNEGNAVDIAALTWLPASASTQLPREWGWTPQNGDPLVTPAIADMTDHPPDHPLAEEWRRAHRLWVAGDYA
jgi:hypothetical protein